MATTWIPGYIAEFKIGSDQLESMIASGTLVQNKNIMLKHVAGAQEPVALAGLSTGTISVSGSVSVEDFAKLNTAFESSAVVVYIFQLGEDGEALDAGAYTGNAMVEGLTAAFDADDSFTFTMDMVLSGQATYGA
jgi:hypothetical protein